MTVLIDTSQSVHGPEEDRVAELCRDIVTATEVTSCGVSMTVADAQAVTAHATDPLADRIEELQHTLGEGPSIDAAQTEQLVAVPDLADPAGTARQRWPMFVNEATKEGLGATFAVPVRLGVICMGALSLYRKQPGPLSERQVDDTWRCADAIAQSLAERPPMGEDAVDESLIVHQAAGMLAVQLGSTVSEALGRLRARAFADGMSVDELAAEVVARRRRLSEEPDE